MADGAPTHLTLPAYLKDGDLILYRCPECGSAGPEGSRCGGHEAPLEVCDLRGPERVAVRVAEVGEPERFTLEQVRAGLLSDGALIAAAAKHRYWDLLQVDSRMTKADLVKEEALPMVRAALDHFTRQPAGVGADGTYEEVPLMADGAPTHLTLPAYLKDGDLILYRCPECGSAGPEGSRCGGHEAPLEVCDLRGPERVAVRVAEVGEPERFTLEQVRAGLLSDGALIAAAAKHRYWDLLQVDSRMTKADLVKEEALPMVRAALDHFTRQPAGVGADGLKRSSQETRSVGENSPGSAESDGSKVGERVEQMRKAGDRAVDAAHSAARHLRNAVQQPEGGDASARSDHARRKCDRSTDVAEGGSGRCAGTALQLREMAEIAARAAFVPPITEDRIADMEAALKTVPLIQAVVACREIASYNAAELREWEEENAADMVDLAAAALTRHPSGGQEADCVIDGCELPGGHKGPHKAWRIVDAPYLEDRDHVEPWEDEVAREIAESGGQEGGDR
jgi:hypothetical protein